MRLKIPLRVRDYKATAAELDEFLAMGGHVSFYMFHGGTTFGLMNGAMRKTSAFAEFRPQISSYDVDALLNEAGDPMPKYFAFREVLLKYNPDAKNIPVPPASKKVKHSDAVFEKCASMRKNIENLSPKTIKCAVLPTMEDTGFNYGFINYSAKIRPQISDSQRLSIYGIRDRVWVNLDGADIGDCGQNDPEPIYKIKVGKNGSTLNILAENQGRVNIGPTMAENRKGITGGVRIQNEYHFGWTANPIPPRRHLENRLEAARQNGVGGQVGIPHVLQGKIRGVGSRRLLRVFRKLHARIHLDKRLPARPLRRRQPAENDIHSRDARQKGRKRNSPA